MLAKGRATRQSTLVQPFVHGHFANGLAMHFEGVRAPYLAFLPGSSRMHKTGYESFLTNQRRNLNREIKKMRCKPDQIIYTRLIGVCTIAQALQACRKVAYHYRRRGGSSATLCPDFFEKKVDTVYEAFGHQKHWDH